jgi:hypothetical protein
VISLRLHHRVVVLFLRYHIKIVSKFRVLLTLDLRY